MINFNIAADNELSIPAVGLLLCIQFATKANDKHKYWSGQITLSPYLEEIEGLYTYEQERYKLNKRGLLIVNKLSNPAASKVTDEDREILEDIEAFCNSNKDRFFIKNKNQLLKSIVGFRIASGLSSAAIKKLIEDFVDEESFKCFDYVFWTPESIFDKVFKLENSRLHDYYKSKSLV